MRRSIALALVMFPAAAFADEPAPPIRVAAVDAIAVPAVPAYAVAGPGAIAPAAAEPTAEPPAAELSGLDRRRRDDAAAGRSYFAETALTAPAGHATFDLRFPALPIAAAGVRFGLTDRIEVGVSTLTVVDEGGAYGLSVKGQLWRSARVAVAAGLNAYTADGETLYNPHVEGTACVGQDCVGAVTLSLNFLGFTDEEAVPVLAGIGVAYGRGVAVIGELHQTRVDDETVTGGFVGLRATAGRIALDGGLGFGMVTSSSCDDCSGDDDGGAFPFFGMTTRL